MKPKFTVGQVVRTVDGWAIQAEGPIREVKQPSAALQALWGDSETHYLIRDNQTGDFISVIERGLEPA